MKLLNHTCAVLVISLTGSGFAGTAFAEPLTDAGQVIQALNSAGYTAVRDVELDDGLWEVEVRRDNGEWHDIHIDPASGTILDKHAGDRLLDAAEIRQKLELAGYTRIHDLDRDEAVWDVDATDPDGASVELRVNGFTGAVLATDPED